MRTAVLACKTIADEIKLAMGVTGCSYPVYWVESGLHRTTELLNRRLQQEIDQIGDVQRVLLAFGFCGNALIGIRPSRFQLIFPRVDDCITLMLGSRERSKNKGTYYLTRGWLQYENNIWEEYRHTVKRYGHEKAVRIFNIILGQYHSLAIIDTGAYCLQEFLLKSETIASALGLKHKVIAGNICYIKKLLTGPWDDDFVTIEPGETITLDHLSLNKTSPNPILDFRYRENGEVGQRDQSYDVKQSYKYI
ncbi:MAG: DUF1638 domain-containing protein [Thermacetogeniaceae bacterium]